MTDPRFISEYRLLSDQDCRMMDEKSIAPRIGGGHMRTALVIDENLLAEAQRLTGLKEKGDLMREALIALIERESARRLAKLGGSEPNLVEIPRRRTDTP